MRQALAHVEVIWTPIRRHLDGYFKTLCGQGGAVNGIAPVKPIENNQCPVEGCAMPMVMSGGMLRCRIMASHRTRRRLSWA